MAETLKAWDITIALLVLFITGLVVIRAFTDELSKYSIDELQELEFTGFEFWMPITMIGIASIIIYIFVKISGNPPRVNGEKI